jgi:hypothetical protein
VLKTLQDLIYDTVVTYFQSVIVEFCSAILEICIVSGFVGRMEQAGPEAQPDGDSYNFVIALCALDRRIAPALKHMQSMYERGFVPSKTTYNELLVACARVHRTRFAVALLKELKVAAIWHFSKDFPSF